MKNIFVIGLLITVGNVFAQSKSVETTVKQPSEKTGFEFGIGLNRLNYNGEDGNESLNGVNLILSKNFEIKNNFATKTSFLIGTLSNENSFNQYDSENKYNTFELTQNISYTIEKNGINYRPFISLGYGVGNYDGRVDGFSEEDRSILGIDSIHTTATYQSRSFSIGLQAELKNNIAPFIAYNWTTLAFKEETAYIEKNDNKSEVEARASLDDINSQAFTAGFVYLF